MTVQNQVEEELAARRRRRLHLPVSGIPVPGIAGIYDWEDDTILRFVCKEITEESVHLAEIAIDSKNHDTMADTAELLCIARAVRNGQPPFKSLWGVAALLELDTRDILNEICLHFYALRLDLIKITRDAYSNPLDQVDLAQALVLAEQVIHRGGLATDLKEAGEHRLTPVQRGAAAVTNKVAHRYLINATKLDA